MPKTSFDIGEKVMAKWPGSSKYYDATVVSLADAKSRYVCTVKFVDSDEMELEMKHGEVYVSIFFIIHYLVGFKNRCHMFDI